MTQRGCLEEIALQIPGFAGYMRREARRDADRAARVHLTAALKEAKDSVARAKTKQAQGSDLSMLGKFETATDRLSRLVSKVTNADSGYSGFFDRNQIDERVLDSVYQLDLALLEGARSIAEAAASPDLDALAERMERFEQEFDRRRSILKGA